MNTALPLQQYPLRERTWLYIIMAILLIAWLCVMLAASLGTSGISEGIHELFAVTVLFAAVVGAVQMRSLARAGAFLGKQQLPHRLWRAWLRSCVAETSVLCALLGTGMAILLATRGSTLPWPAGVALISAVLSLGAIAILHHHSMVARRLGLLSNCAAGALVLAVAGIGAAPVIDAVAAWPVPVLALLALAWPALAASLMLGRSRQLDALRTAPTIARKPVFAHSLSQLRRYAPLDAANWRETPRTSVSQARELRAGWLFYLTLPIYFYFSDLKPLGWNEEPDARHLLSLLGLAVIMTVPLMARDLHWRAMLMPGGWRNGRIGSHIFAATLKAQYGVLAAAAMASVVFQCVVRRAGVGDAVQAVAEHTLLLAAIPFAIAVALVIRALPQSNRIRIGMGVVVTAIWLYLRFVAGYVNLTHLPAGGLAYALVLAVLTWPTLHLANRIWTPEKLMACARGAGK